MVTLCTKLWRPEQLHSHGLGHGKVRLVIYMCLRAMLAGWLAQMKQGYC
jgi:hypothetical protein